MELSFLCFMILISHSYAGYFSRRNVTRRMYYEALKEESQDVKAKAYESFITSGNADELPQKLQELIDAANFKDAPAADDCPAGEEYTEKGVLQIYDEKEKDNDILDAEIEKAADIVITAGEEFGAVNEHSENKIADAVSNIMLGEKYVSENTFKMPENLVTTRKRPRMEGRRRQRKRRRRRRKNRLINHGTTEYAENETITNARQLSHSDERHSRDVNGEEEVQPMEKSNEAEPPQTESSVSKKSEITEKSTEGVRFDWQKPAGQWHLPTGQFQQISGNLDKFAGSERRRNTLFRSAGIKYMVYTGELDSKMDAN